MRLLLVTLTVGALAAAAAADIVVDIDQPETHRYVESVSGPDTTWVEVEVVALQQAIDLSHMLINHPYAGYPGHDDTVFLMPDRYDSVSTFVTVFGVKTAIAGLREGVTLRGGGDDRNDVILDQLHAEYGILCQDVSAATVVESLTITGGGGRDRGRVDDGDARDLAAGIACLDGAYPTIRSVSIERAATGIVVNTLHGEAAPTIKGVLIARGSHHGVYIQDNGPTPVEILRTTIVDNFDIGVYVYNGSATITNSCITHNRLHGIKSYLVVPPVENCNLFYNDRESEVPEEYGGNITDQTGINGNISEEPFYCDFFGDFGYIYLVCDASPNVPPQSTVGQIGAFGVGCQDCESPVSETSWGAIKALYR
jgi:hypothetical protein